jgi:Fic-DOC domain mobile mystery protein B
MSLIPEDTTPLDFEESNGLKLSYISTRSELNAAEAVNIESGLRWAGESRTLDEVLSVDFLCELHKRMFGDVWNWAGDFRKTNKNLGVPWWDVPVAVIELIRDTTAWTTGEEFAWTIDEIGIRFHHRLVSIHPFPNGNGRHSRASADLLVESLGANRFTWGRTDFTDVGETRTNYIEALRAADRGDFDPLLNFVRG